jgi:electron transport complex protein RnfB
MKEISLAEEIDATLPQTQCRQCGFSGCRPYAEAIAEGRAQINQCPPGGEDGIHQLARLLGVKPLPLNTAHGVFKPKEVASIDEHSCIGCTLCIQACPVDAIVGAARQMHTIISGECTGCSLCVKACPVDCISMIPIMGYSPPAGTDTPAELAGLTHKDLEVEKKKAADRARARYQFRLQRLEREKQERAGRLAKRTEATVTVERLSSTASLKKVTVQAALERAKAARTQASSGISKKEDGSDRTQDILHGGS